VWAASRRRDIRKGIFHDALFPIKAVGTENVAFPKPVSFDLSSVDRSHCLSNLFFAIHPPAQFLSFVVVNNFDLIFITVVVRHVFSPYLGWVRISQRELCNFAKPRSPAWQSGVPGIQRTKEEVRCTGPTYRTCIVETVASIRALGVRYKKNILH
jgi:hypothetical protein